MRFREQRNYSVVQFNYNILLDAVMYIRFDLFIGNQPKIYSSATHLAQRPRTRSIPSTIASTKLDCPTNHYHSISDSKVQGPATTLTFVPPITEGLNFHPIFKHHFSPIEPTYVYSQSIGDRSVGVFFRRAYFASDVEGFKGFVDELHEKCRPDRSIKLCQMRGVRVPC